MSKEHTIPVKYNDKLIGWANSENPGIIKFINDDCRKLIEEQLQQPISISSRKVGKIENGKVEITRHIEDVILNLNKDE